MYHMYNMFFKKTSYESRTFKPRNQLHPKHVYLHYHYPLATFHTTLRAFITLVLMIGWVKEAIPLITMCVWWNVHGCTLRWFNACWRFFCYEHFPRDTSYHRPAIGPNYAPCCHVTPQLFFSKVRYPCFARQDIQLPEFTMWPKLALQVIS